MAAESYWGSNPVTTTVLVSPSPTTTVFTVASITDFIDEQFLLVEVAGDFERAQIDSISGSQITLKEALSDAPDVPGAVKSGRTLLTNSKLNGGAVFHADDIASAKAVDFTNAPNGIYYRIPDYGLYRFDSGSSETGDDEFVIDPTTGPGRLLQEHKADRYNKAKKFTTSATWSAFTHTADAICKVTADLTDATNGSAKVYSGATLLQTILAGAVSTRSFDLSDDLSIVSSGIFEDISNSVYDSVTLDTSADLGYTYDFRFNPDGTKMLVAGGYYNFNLKIRMYEYDLSTPFDITTAVYLDETADMNGGINPSGFDLSSDGTHVYRANYTTIYQYDFSTAWDVSTMSSPGYSFSVSSQDSYINGFRVSEDGTKLWLAGDTNNRVFQYTLSTPYRISTATYDSKSFLFSAQTGDPAAFFLLESESKFWVMSTSEVIYEYECSNIYDISTATYTGNSFSAASQVTNGEGVMISLETGKLYISDVGNDIYQYSIETAFAGTAFVEFNVSKPS